MPRFLHRLSLEVTVSTKSEINDIHNEYDTKKLKTNRYNYLILSSLFMQLKQGVKEK